MTPLSPGNRERRMNSSEMSYEHSIQVLEKEAVRVECGPMRLIIQAFREGQPETDIALAGAQESLIYLERVARMKKLLSVPAAQWVREPRDEIAREMYLNTLAVGDADLTPMAGVAGAIADAVADFLFARGPDKVIVDNGGDVSIRLRGPETVRIGVRPWLHERDVFREVSLDSSMSSWGICTSGLGGQSFTRGIASGVTVLSNRATLADVAATSIANACFIEHDSVAQVEAGELDPETDIPGVPVTCMIGALSDDLLREALEKGRNKAESFYRENLLFGSSLAIGDYLKEVGRILSLEKK